MTQAQFQGSKDVASWICKTFLQPGHQSWRFLIWSQEPVVNSTTGWHVTQVTWQIFNVFCVCVFLVVQQKMVGEWLGSYNLGGGIWFYRGEPHVVEPIWDMCPWNDNTSPSRCDKNTWLKTTIQYTWRILDSRTLYMDRKVCKSICL